MITPDHLRTAQQILHRAGLDASGAGPRTAAALIAVHLANLPPEPEMWGATPEPMSSEDHMRAAVLDACRTAKTVGWVPDAMTVAILACANTEATHAGQTTPTSSGGVVAGDPFLAAGVEPAQKKPRCGRVDGQKESMPPIPMVCTRPEGHKGACGEAKVVGKAKAAEVGS